VVRFGRGVCTGSEEYLSCDGLKWPSHVVTGLRRVGF
jgi:hypothetical protein